MSPDDEMEWALVAVADAHWRAALMLDYVGQRFAQAGFIPGHTDGRHRCSAIPHRPVCAAHGLSQIHHRLTRSAAIPMGQLNHAYQIALREVPHSRLHACADGPKAQLELVRVARALREAFVPNPRQPRIRSEFASLLAIELASITCWRCAATSHSVADVAESYCGACHASESDPPLPC